MFVAKKRGKSELHHSAAVSGAVAAKFQEFVFYFKNSFLIMKIKRYKVKQADTTMKRIPARVNLH
ncbi:hypothetical protein HCH_01437 [Hahella chejuensis KCTC 2396]|uniref:Uncharacterized protein n=1 Tax=Hahella chejuensis (strain KCTC 2396) TaxID=349521 RepID=Q2SM26_HAHCH|nr:hypothetical protein HCH_01437 [Hahella chejuensis KCTC 2396]